MKNNDIYRWRYNQKTLEELEHGKNGGTTYWCCSQIGIFKEGWLKDTYWGNSNDSRRWNEKEINDKLILTFVANMDDLKKVSGKCEFNNYEDKDCINLNHPNTSGEYYIYRDATSSLNKKRRVFEAHIKYEKERVDWHKKEVKWLEDKLKNLTIDTFTPCNSKVYIPTEDEE